MCTRLSRAQNGNNAQKSVLFAQIQTGLNASDEDKWFHLPPLGRATERKYELILLRREHTLRARECLDAMLQSV